MCSRNHQERRGGKGDRNHQRSAARGRTGPMAKNERRVSQLMGPTTATAARARGRRTEERREPAGKASLAMRRERKPRPKMQPTKMRETTPCGCGWRATAGGEARRIGDRSHQRSAARGRTGPMAKNERRVNQLMGPPTATAAARARGRRSSTAGNEQTETEQERHVQQEEGRVETKTLEPTLIIGRK
jgi:hypothetical protein